MAQLDFKKGDYLHCKKEMYIISSIKHQIELGEVKWFAPWKKYALVPNEWQVWSSDHLQEVALFIKNLMKSVPKEEQKEPKPVKETIWEPPIEPEAEEEKEPEPVEKEPPKEEEAEEKKPTIKDKLEIPEEEW